MQLARTEVVPENEIVSAQTTEVTTLLTPTNLSEHVRNILGFTKRTDIHDPL